MAGGEDQDGIAELATEAVAPIEQELRERLVAEVGDRDVLAIETALLKAFINGMRAGAAESAEAFIEQPGRLTGLGGAPLPSAPPLDPSLPWIDPWAARYGGG